MLEINYFSNVKYNLRQNWKIKRERERVFSALFFNMMPSQRNNKFSRSISYKNYPCRQVMVHVQTEEGRKVAVGASHPKHVRINTQEDHDLNASIMCQQF
jgi:hypothetical protein